MDKETQHYLEQIREGQRRLYEKMQEVVDRMNTVAHILQSPTPIKPREQIVFDCAFNLIRELKPHPGEREMSDQCVDHAIEIVEELYDKSGIENCRVEK